MAAPRNRSGCLRNERCPKPHKNSRYGKCARTSTRTVAVGDAVDFSCDFSTFKVSEMQDGRLRVCRGVLSAYGEASRRGQAQGALGQGGLGAAECPGLQVAQGGQHREAGVCRLKGILFLSTKFGRSCPYSRRRASNGRFPVPRNRLTTITRLRQASLFAFASINAQTSSALPFACRVGHSREEKAQRGVQVALVGSLGRRPNPP